MHNGSHFDSKCCESYLSLSRRFVQTHPLTSAINNQMNSVLPVLQLIVYKVHILSADLNIKFVQRSVNGETCSWVESHCLKIANVEKGSTEHVCLGL